VRIGKWLSVKVTTEDIKHGREAQFFGTGPMPELCPIALALQRAEGEFVKVNGNGQINIGNKKYIAAPMTKKFIERFDDRKNVRPFRAWMSAV
jgi:hypothetical protein